MTSRDERRVFLSYHGENTGGADWVTFSADRLSRCSSQHAANTGCIALVHGAIEGHEDNVIATLGTPPRLAEFDRRGAMIRDWPSGLRRAHAIEFAFNGRDVFTTETCSRFGGMSVVNLATGRAQVLHPPSVSALYPDPSLVCGDRISVGARSLVALAKRPKQTTASQQGSGSPSVILIDGASGRILNKVPTKSDPVDVLVWP
jgi:hypothetical protein